MNPDPSACSNVSSLPARLLLSACALALLALSGCSSNSAPGFVAGDSDSHPRAPDYEFSTLDGGVRKLSEFRGKVVIVDFWATWCPPCREEIPHLIKLHNENKNNELVIIGLSIEDPRRAGATVRGFAQQTGINYLVGYAPPAMSESYLVGDDRPIPQTLIFGKDGKKIEHLIGFNPLREGVQLRRAVDFALAQ